MICHNEVMGGKSLLTTYGDPPFNNIQVYWHLHDWDDLGYFEISETWYKIARVDDEVADQLPFQIPFSYLSRKGE